MSDAGRGKHLPALSWMGCLEAAPYASLVSSSTPSLLYSALDALADSCLERVSADGLPESSNASLLAGDGCEIHGTEGLTVDMDHS